MIDVVKDWQDAIGVKDDDVTVLLQPSSPLRTPDLVVRVLATAMQDGNFA